MQTRIVHQNHPEALSLSLEFLHGGELIAFPTDTVYGVGCSVLDPIAIDKIYAVKGRDTMKAIPVLIANLGQLDLICTDLSTEAERLANKFWPGALTLILPKKTGLPPNLSPYKTIGVRIPAHSFALSLISASGPLAATSANRSGEANPLCASDVLHHMKNKIPLIIDGGNTAGDTPSTVVECDENGIKILRQGAISQSALENALL